MKTGKRFNLPQDYYVTVHPLMTVAVIAVMWILFPTLAFFPNALDFVVNDTIGDFIEDNRYNLIKMFNVQVWVIITFTSFSFWNRIRKAQSVNSSYAMFLHIFFQLHMIECIVAIQKCRLYGISPSTTLKWICNVGTHGIFALRYLLWPQEEAQKIKVHWKDMKTYLTTHQSKIVF